MSVKKEASGRRSVQVEVEVPGTPEEVWQAIGTGPGISSWFVPAEIEERDGKPVAVKLNFGPGMESSSVVTAWDPPRRFVAEAPGWLPGSPVIAAMKVQKRAPETSTNGVTSARRTGAAIGGTAKCTTTMATSAAAASFPCRRHRLGRSIGRSWAAVSRSMTGSSRKGRMFMRSSR